jgi:hypothetical protein
MGKSAPTCKANNVNLLCGVTTLPSTRPPGLENYLRCSTTMALCVVARLKATRIIFSNLNPSLCGWATSVELITAWQLLDHYVKAIYLMEDIRRRAPSMAVKQHHSLFVHGILVTARSGVRERNLVNLFSSWAGDSFACQYSNAACDRVLCSIQNSCSARRSKQSDICAGPLHRPVTPSPNLRIKSPVAEFG